MRSELWAKGEESRLALGRVRGAMANWRVDEGSHAMNVKCVEEVEGGGKFSIELESWLQDLEHVNRVG